MPDPGCEFPRQNASSEDISKILGSVKTIAVVGISPKEERPSHWISLYLRDNGFDVVGVNPGHTELMGFNVYPTLAAVPGPVDLVNVFIRSENVPPVVDDAIAKKAKAIWMQEGVVNNAAADKARAAGLIVVMNKCIYKEHASQ